MSMEILSLTELNYYLKMEQFHYNKIINKFIKDRILNMEYKNMIHLMHKVLQDLRKQYKNYCKQNLMSCFKMKK
jgi:hypothetical protein